MGVNTKWDAQEFINLTLDELCKKYPSHKRNKLGTLKRYYERKNMEQNPEKERNFEEVLKLHNLSPELAQEFTEQGFHIGYIKNSEGEIEYTIPLPNAKKRSTGEVFDQAQPAEIRPTRAKPPKRDHRLLFVFGDAQIDYRRLEDGELDPIHDERVLRLAHLMCKDLKPDEIINVGDTIDLAGLSRFAPDSDHFHRTIGPSFQRVHDMYAQFYADSPWAKITEVDSNHNTRLKKFMLNNASPLYGLHRPGEEDYPVMTYPYLANLKPLGVNWVSGYGAAEYVYGQEYDRPPIVFKHGTTATKTGVARKESADNPYTHVVRGHSHRAESHYRTMRDGVVLGSFVVGVACRTTGEVPSYHSGVDDNNRVVPFQEDWQQGFMVIEDYNGHYNFNHVIVENGVAFYKGREYNAGE